MATVRKRTLRARTYYYLEHTARVDGQVRKREVYLGPRVPSDIELRKRAFLAEIYQERWHPLLDRIRRGYGEEVRRMPPSAREKERETFATVFTYNTQRIEGSTLTLRETADLLERGVTPASRPMRDIHEAEAHRDIVLRMHRDPRDITLGLALEWHRRLFRDTRPDIAGRIREHQVAISGSRFLPPSPVEVYPLLREFFRWAARTRGTLHPVERAALAHLKFVTIHPFADGNGRISRLLMNSVLHQAGFPMLVIPYGGRNRYYTALERAQTKAMDFVFVQWFVKRYLREHRRFLAPAPARPGRVHR